MTGAAGGPSGRGISTVVDVTFALLLVSASIAVLGIYLTEDEQPNDPMEADQTAETLSATTARVTYSLDPAIEDTPAFQGKSPSSYEASTKERVAHGTVANLLAEAAVTNLSIDGREVSKAGSQFQEKMEGNVRDILTSSETDAHVVAHYRPYEGGSILGVAEAGPKPPAGADVSTATLTLDTRFTDLSDREIADAYDSNGIRGVSTLIAWSIVQGYFPTEETQLALEQQGLEQEMAAYRYRKMKWALDESPATGSDVSWGMSIITDNVISRNGANAGEANSALVESLSDVIYHDLDSKYGGASMTGEEFANRASIDDDVRIVVQTW